MESGTALHCVAFADHHKIAQILVDAGADLDAKDDLDRTPLHQAALCGAHRTVAVLVRAPVGVLELQRAAEAVANLIGRPAPTGRAMPASSSRAAAVSAASRAFGRARSASQVRAGWEKALELLRARLDELAAEELGSSCDRPGADRD